MYRPTVSLGGFRADNNAVYPDGVSFRNGVTTFVDPGGSGWRNFEDLKDRVIDRSETRVLAFINIVLALTFLVKYTRAGRVRDLTLGLGFFALGFLSKESTVTMVVGIPLTLWFFTRIPRARLITVLVSLGVMGSAEDSGWEVRSQQGADR